MTTTARSFLPSRLFAVLLCLALVPVLIVGRTAKAFAAPLTVTVIIDSILQIDDPEDGFDDGSCWGDFEFTVDFGGQQTVSPEFSIDPAVRDGLHRRPGHDPGRFLGHAHDRQLAGRRAAQHLGQGHRRHQ